MGSGLFVTPLPVVDFVPALVDLAATVFDNTSVTINLETNAGASVSTGNVPASEVKSAKTLADFVKKFDGTRLVLVTKASIQIKNAHAAITYDIVNPLIGEFSLAFGTDAARGHSAVVAITRLFRATPYRDLIQKQMAAADVEGLRMREQSVADLQRAIDALSQKLLELSVQDSENRRKASEALEERLRQKADELEQAHRERTGRLEVEHESRRATLEKAEEEHAARVKAFDTNEAKYTRRELKKEINEVLDATKTFSVAQGTERKRRTVHVFTWLLMAVAAVSVYLFGREVILAFPTPRPTGWEPPDWHLYVPLAASSATLVTTFLYYLKWNDRWFREHADQEFAAVRYRADILRASWVAELASEWRKESNEQLPTDLTSAFTRNLFRPSGAPLDVDHPLEVVTGAMRRVTSITVGKDRFSVRALGDAVRRRSADDSR